MDLFSQAEHGEDSESILISPDADFLDRVAAAMAERVTSLPREAIVRASISGRGALILVRDLDEDCAVRSEEHTSELQSLMRISYAVFCLKKKTKTNNTTSTYTLIRITKLRNKIDK